MTHSIHVIQKKIIPAFLLLVFLLFPGCAGASADSAAPLPTAVSYAEYNKNVPDEQKVYIGLYNVLEPQSAQANDLYTLKRLLYGNGYYAAAGVGNTDIDWQNNQLDNSTLNALREYCIRSNVPQFDSRLGLTYGAWWRISTGEIIDLNKQETDDGGYKAIEWMQGGEGLTAVINRLYELKYIESRDHTVYDADVQNAIAEFGKNNGLQNYYKEGDEAVRAIDADLQNVLFAEDAVEKPAPAKPTLRDYFMKSVNILGLKIPMPAVWGVALLVLVGCVFTTIHFFAPTQKKHNKKRPVQFEINYNGKTNRISAVITKTLTIGREVGNFPLDSTDLEISRKHCELYYINNDLMLRDFSRFGTYVNRKQVHNAAEIINSGDVLTIGKHTITITF